MFWSKAKPEKPTAAKPEADKPAPPDTFALLMIEARTGNEAKVRSLLSELTAASLQNSDQDGKTPLSIASEYGNLAVVEALIDKGADVHFLETQYKYPAIVRAAQRGYLKVVKLLLERGANVDAGNMWNRTALIEASGNGHVEVMTFLMNHGANIHVIDTFDSNAVMYAAQNGHTNAVALLRDRGANTILIGKGGRMALSFAAEYNRADTVRLLLDNGSPINHQDSKGETALMHAAKASGGHVATLTLLLERGASTSLQDQVGKTALMHATNVDAKALLKRVWAGAPSPAPAPSSAAAAVTAPAPAAAEQLPAPPVPPPAQAAPPPPPPPTSTMQTPSIEKEEDDSALDPVLPADPFTIRVAALEDQQQRLTEQVQGLPQFLTWWQKRSAALEKLRAAERVNAYAAIVTHGMLLTELEQEERGLTLSRECCATLKSRQASLIEEMVEVCKDLRVAKQFVTLVAFGAKLEAVRALDLSAVPNIPVPDPDGPRQIPYITEISVRQAALLAQAAGLRATRAWIERRDAAEAQLSAADSAEPVDFSLIGSLSLQLDALSIEGAALALSEEECKSLPDRYDALVRETVRMCEDLVKERAYVSLRLQADALEALYALNSTGELRPFDDSPNSCEAVMNANAHAQEIMYDEF